MSTSLTASTVFISFAFLPTEACFLVVSFFPLLFSSPPTSTVTVYSAQVLVAEQSEATVRLVRAALPSVSLSDWLASCMNAHQKPPVRNFWWSWNSDIFQSHNQSQCDREITTFPQDQSVSTGSISSSEADINRQGKGRRRGGEKHKKHSFDCYGFLQCAVLRGEGCRFFPPLLFPLSWEMLSPLEKHLCIFFHLNACFISCPKPFAGAYLTACSGSSQSVEKTIISLRPKACSTRSDALSEGGGIQLSTQLIRWPPSGVQLLQ